MGMEFGSTKRNRCWMSGLSVEPMLDEWAAHGQPACSVLGLLKTVPGLCKLDQKRPCFGCLKLMK